MVVTRGEKDNREEPRMTANEAAEWIRDEVVSNDGRMFTDETDAQEAFFERHLLNVKNDALWESYKPVFTEAFDAVSAGF